MATLRGRIYDRPPRPLDPRARRRRGRGEPPQRRALAHRAGAHHNESLDLAPGRRSVTVAVDWLGAQPIDRVEIVRDGEVVGTVENPERSLQGQATLAVDAEDAGWLAARAWGRQRTSYGHAL